MATTYFVDEYIDSTLRSLHLCPSVELYFHLDFGDFADTSDISIFWHKPSINLGWYPICQIDVGDKTIFHREGSENADHWDDLLIQAADFLSTWKPKADYLNA